MSTASRGREPGWVERRLVGSVLLNGQGLFVSVVTFPTGKRSVALSVGKLGETPRGLVMGPFLARVARDLLDAAIAALGDDESPKQASDRRRHVAHVLEAASHARLSGLSERRGGSSPAADPGTAET